MAAAYVQRIRENSNLLMRTIDPTYELIGSLQLNLEAVFDFALLNSKTTPNDIITYLLVSLRTQQQNVFEAFISLLNEKNQEHAAALISGKQTTNKVHMSDEHFKTLCDKSLELRRFVNPFGGLLDHLMSTDTFQLRDKERVQSKRMLSIMAEELVNVLRRKWDQAFENFLNALNETGQPHVAYILTGLGEERPMRDDRLDYLKENRVTLTQNLTPADSHLLSKLIECKAFDDSDAEWICNQTTITGQAEQLIAILTRKPNSAFDKFIEALKETGHGFVSDEFTKKTINGLVETRFSSGVTKEHRNTSDGTIVDSINQQSKCKTILKGNGVLLGGSMKCIRVHFTCLNVQAIDTLDRLYNTGELLKLFTDSFSHIYQQHGIESCVIRIATEEFERCRRQFSESVFMKPSKRLALQYAMENLLSKIVVNDNFLQRLALDERRIRAVVEAGKNSRKVEKLLDIISRQPDDLFSKFIEALENAGQQETASIIKTLEKNAAKAESKTSFEANRRLSLVSKAGRKRSLSAPPKLNEEDSSSSQEIDSNKERVIEGSSSTWKKSIQLQQSVSTLAPSVQSAGLAQPVVKRKSTQHQWLEDTTLCSAPTGVAGNDVEDDVEAASRQAQCGKLSEIIQRLRYNLTSMVDVDYGLLDELWAMGVVTEQQVVEVQSERTIVSRVAQLLDFVVKMPDEQQEQFLIALDETQQSHISEYIRAGGNLSSLNKDNWPLFCCDEVWMLKKNYAMLTDTIDLKCGLLDELCAEGLISRRQMKAIEAQNEALLDLMYRKSFADFHKLLRCLERTKQSLVMSLLSSSYTYSDQPLSDALKARLIKNHAILMELIDTRCDLLGELQASDCITRRQRIYIESKDSNGRLLDVLSRGSEADFMKFIDGLKKTGQEHVARILKEDGVVVQLVAKTCCYADEERLIAERFMGLLSNITSEKMESLYSQVTRHVNELRSRGIDLIAANTQHSIGLFYLCRSLDALQYLYELFTSGELKQTVERTFTLLLNEEKSVVVDSLNWDVQDYVKGLQDFNEALYPKTYYELYDLAKCVRLESTASGLCVDKLPTELLQLILNKAMGQLFVIIHRVTPRAAVYAMATLGGVSTLWWRTITCRQYSKRVLKRYFQHVCSPFKCNPQRLQSLRIEGYVGCLTEFNGQLYVGVLGSNSVRVFLSLSPFSRLDDITVQGLNDPWDIVVCRDTSQFYIADGSQYVIWRVNLLGKKQVDKFITIQWQPLRLSVNYRRLLITPYDGAALFLYSDDGSQLNRIQLPDYLWALHAVETTHNTFIVSHVNRGFEDTESEHKSVSEVNFDGRLVRTFNSQHIDIGSIQFNWPCYLVLDDNNHVIVADRLNERVVVLKSDLQLKRILTRFVDQLPSSLCLSKSTGLLFIKHWHSSNIDIYQTVS